MVLLSIGGRLTDPISTIHLELNIEDNNNTSRSGLIIILVIIILIEVIRIMIITSCMIHGVDCKSTINNKIGGSFWVVSAIDRMIDSAVSRECKYIDERGMLPILVNINKIAIDFIFNNIKNKIAMLVVACMTKYSILLVNLDFVLCSSIMHKNTRLIDSIIIQFPINSWDWIINQVNKPA